jgi:hypothetical protein
MQRHLVARVVGLGFLVSSGVCADCLGRCPVHPHFPAEPLRLTEVIWICDRCAERRRRLGLWSAAPSELRSRAAEETARLLALGATAGFDSRYCRGAGCGSDRCYALRAGARVAGCRVPGTGYRVGTGEGIR